MKWLSSRSIAATSLLVLALFAVARLAESTARLASVAQQTQRVWANLAERPVRGRLAGLAAHRLYQSPRRHEATVEADQATVGYRGAKRARDLETEARAVAWLVAGGEAHQASRALRRMTDSGGRSAEWDTWNNLSVALLENAFRHPERGDAAFRDRLDALEAAARAFELAPGAQEALFNKALALEALHLPRQAAKTWRCYLEKDRQSGWAREAQARLDRLEHRLGRIRRAAAGAEPTALEAKLAALRREPLSPQAEIRALIDEANAAGQPAMVAAATRTLAHRTSLDGRLAASADLYADATRRFETLGDANQAADARVMRAEILGALARLNEALAELADVLAVAEDLRDPLRRHAAYWVAGNVVASVAPAAANALWSEAAEACRDMPDRPWCAVDARIRLAREAPSPSWAKKELAAAARDLELIPASREKNRTELDLAMVQAKWLQREPSARNLEAADRLYKQVIEGFDAMASPVSVAKARAGRVDVLTRLGMAPAARAELEASLLSLRLWDDTQRFRPEASEAGTPGALRDVFERLISLYLAESGNDLSVRALLLAEEMRDRLAPRLAHRFEAMTEADLAQFVEELAPESAVVEIVVLDSPEPRKRLAVAWIFAAGSLKQVSLPLPAKLEAILDEVRQSAEAANLRSWRRTTAELWGGLVGPVLAEVPAGTRRLAIVPDAELYGVPFRGLWNPEARRYLDEDFEVVLAPSLRSLTPALPVQNRDLMQGPVLAAAFESFSALGLGNLASAMAEKEAVASVYGETAMSPCAATDWSTLRRCLPEAAMVHLATHAAADSQRPGWSWLALPQETVSLERLWSELPPLPLRPLVVLSACESVATAKGGEGLGGLARPFLARGARAVVGTLWRIADVDAAAYFPLFHQAYRETGNEAEALRRARERLADWRRRPWTWGSVAVIGATT